MLSTESCVGNGTPYSIVLLEVIQLEKVVPTPVYSHASSTKLLNIFRLNLVIAVYTESRRVWCTV
jgi:hypothetical protein